MEAKCLKISKELFAESIGLVKKGAERIRIASDAIESLIDGCAVITVGEEYLKAALSLLKDAVGDTDDMIEWWLYEDVEKKVKILPSHSNNKTGKSIEVKILTPEDLYDYFVNWN